MAGNRSDRFDPLSNQLDLIWSGNPTPEKNVFNSYYDYFFSFYEYFDKRSVFVYFLSYNTKLIY